MPKNIPPQKKYSDVYIYDFEQFINDFYKMKEVFSVTNYSLGFHVVSFLKNEKTTNWKNENCE